MRPASSQMDIEVLPKHSKLSIFYGYVSTAYGQVLSAFHKDKPCAIHFIEEKDTSCGLDELRRRWPAANMVKNQRQATEQLNKMKNRNPVLLMAGTPFQIAVWQELLKIPLGKLVCYQDIARKTGRDKAFRAVGVAVGQNPLAMIVPCHRVMHKSGKSTAYRWGKAKKLMMIRDESQGISVFPPC